MQELSPDELKTLQLGVLRYFHEFCVEHNLKYSIYAGTLIGTIRHKGFIPWDDDIDVMMRREEYDKLIKIYPQENKNKRFKLVSPEIDESLPYTFSKLSDETTVLIEDCLIPHHIGVNIDIFPIEDLPDDPAERDKIFKKRIRLRKMLDCKIVGWNKSRPLWKNVVLATTRFFLKPISYKKLVADTIALAKKYQGCPGDYCGDVVMGYNWKEVQKRSNFDEYLLMPFEDGMFYVCKGYENYLRSTFGDYMQLPPPEQRITHHSFKAYWKDSPD